VWLILEPKAQPTVITKCRNDRKAAIIVRPISDDDNEELYQSRGAIAKRRSGEEFQERRALAKPARLRSAGEIE